VSLPTDELRRLLKQADGLPAKDAQQLLAGLAAEVNTRSAADGLFWLKFVVTRDEADPANSVKAFPLHLEYTQLIWRELATKQKVIIAKSRQMLMSWLLACFCVWWARYKPNQAVYWQTKAWDDAVSMVCMPSGGFMARCQFVEEHLPNWMKIPFKASEGRIQYDNGSIIQALAGGADKIRGKTVSVAVEDEFAFQDDQDGVYTAMAPLIQKGSKVIFVSTPNGTSNQFATLYHGRNVATETPVE
jgi:phage FluMu gp28-like protein